MRQSSGTKDRRVSVKGAADAIGLPGLQCRAETERVNIAWQGLWEGTCLEDIPGRNCYGS